MSKNNKKVVEEEQKVEQVPKEPVISLDDYLKESSVHEGLVSSFKFEALTQASLLEDKSKSDWDKAFKEQSEKTY